MTANDLLADVLAQDLNILKMIVSDFSDQDMLVRPVPGANHAAWQLGHLAVSEAGMINSAVPGAVPAPPAEFSDRFNKQSAGSDDPAAFPKKAELIAALEKVRQGTVRWAKSLSPQDMQKRTSERMQGFAATVGLLAGMISPHTQMHVGQLQVIRRKLGKPVLF